MKTVLLIGSLDTKGEEYAYAREMLRARKLSVHVMDFSVMDEPSTFKPDVSAADVAEAGGSRRRRTRSMLLSRTKGVAGFFGASSIERLATEAAIEDQTRKFKAIKLT